MATDANTTDDAGRPDELAQLVTELTEAIGRLADRSHRPRLDPDDAAAAEQRRRRERVDFGYRALGTLIGRVSRTDDEFDVDVFAARWQKKYEAIRLIGLPDDAQSIELRRGRKVERVLVRRHDARDGWSSDEKAANRPSNLDTVDREPDPSETDSDKWHPRPFIVPKRFGPDEEIGSMLAIRGRHDRPVAIGPRLRPRSAGSRLPTQPVPHVPTYA